MQIHDARSEFPRLDLGYANRIATTPATASHIAHKIVYEELINFRPKDYRFSGITMNLNAQSLIEDQERKYDRGILASLAGAIGIGTN